MVTLLWIRHAATPKQMQNRYVGQIDPALSDLGRKQARQLAERLKCEPLLALYTSDLIRARETAMAIASVHPGQPGLMPVPAAELRELAFGAWEGRSYEEIAACDEAALFRFYDNPWRVSPPGGETVSDLKERLARFLRHLCERHAEGETVAAVSHAGPIRLFQAVWLENDPGGLFRFHLPYAGILRARYDSQQGRWRYDSE